MSEGMVEGLNGLSFTREEADVISQSHQMREIWSNPLLRSAIEEFLKTIGSDLMSTEPDQEKERERIFWKHKGVEELATFVAQIIGQGDLIIQEKERLQKVSACDTDAEEDIVD